MKTARINNRRCATHASVFLCRWVQAVWIRVWHWPNAMENGVGVLAKPIWFGPIRAGHEATGVNSAAVDGIEGGNGLRVSEEGFGTA